MMICHIVAQAAEVPVNRKSPSAEENWGELLQIFRAAEVPTSFSDQYHSQLLSGCLLPHANMYQPASLGIDQNTLVSGWVDLECIHPIRAVGYHTHEKRFPNPTIQ